MVKTTSSSFCCSAQCVNIIKEQAYTVGTFINKCLEWNNELGIFFGQSGKLNRKAFAKTKINQLHLCCAELVKFEFVKKRKKERRNL